MIGNYIYIYIQYIPYDWLVVWNMAFMNFHVLGIMIPTDELILFRRNHQPVDDDDGGDDDDVG